MRLYKIFICLMVVISVTTTVGGYLINEITAPPSTYSTSATADVNVSGGINASYFTDVYGDDDINFSVQTKTNSSGGWSNLAHSTGKASNGSLDNFWNLTVTLSEGYNWVRINFTNVSRVVSGNNSFAGSLSPVRIINVDTEKYKLEVGDFGKINFTLDTGNISTSGSIVVGGCIKYNCSKGGCVTLGDCG